MKQYAGLNLQKLIPFDGFFKKIPDLSFGYKILQVPSFKALELR